MSSANVDLVRAIYAGWERGDFSATEWAHPEIEVVRADGLEPGSSGLAEMAQNWRGFLSAWEDARVEAMERRELDDERVLLRGHWSGRGRTSGLELGRMQGTGANVFHMRDGKVTKLVLYWDYDRALADLGLAPEGGSLGTERPP
jgi:ketosteroid isomerase-like protein